MSMFLYWMFLAILFITLLFSVIYSFRYRRQQEPILRGLYKARMNVAMGCMLIDFAFMQMLLFDENGFRSILAVLFVLIGLFNLFSGLRSHSYYIKLKDHSIKS